MERKLLLASLSITFVVAMYAINQKTGAEHFSKQYATNSISRGGGLKTNAFMPHQFVSPKTVAYHYTKQTVPVKNATNIKSIISSNPVSISMPLNLLPIDTYNACEVSPENCTIDMRSYTLPLSRINKSQQTGKTTCGKCSLLNVKSWLVTLKK